MPSSDLFSTRLLGAFASVCLGLERKIWSLQQMAEFVDRRSKIARDYARSLEKMLQRAPSVMWTVLEMWSTLVQTEEQYADVFTALAQRLDTLMNEGQSLKKQLDESLALLGRLKERYHRAKRELELADASRGDPGLPPDPSASPAKRQSAKSAEAERKRLQRLRDDACESESAYRAQLTATNTLQRDYYTIRMPQLLKACDLLPFPCLSLSAAMCTSVAQMGDPARALDMAIASIDAESDVEEFVQKTDNAFAVPEDLDFEAYVPGDTHSPPSGSKMLGRWSVVGWSKSFTLRLGSSASQDSQQQSQQPLSPHQQLPNAVFRVPLEQLMARQLLSHADLPVPVVLRRLVDCVIDLGAARARGVFRVSSVHQEIDAARLALDTSPDAELPTDVHTVANLLKLWIRSLPDPLIPASQYNMAMAEGAQAGKIFETLPEPNRAVVGYIVRFLQFMTRPEHVEQTLMSVNNMAAVFAPCLLHCPYDDLAASLQAAEKERTFVMDLIKSLDTAPFLELAQDSGKPPAASEETTDAPTAVAIVAPANEQVSAAPADPEQPKEEAPTSARPLLGTELSSDVLQFSPFVPRAAGGSNVVPQPSASPVGSLSSSPLSASMLSLPDMQQLPEAEVAVQPSRSPSSEHGTSPPPSSSPSRDESLSPIPLGAPKRSTSWRTQAPPPRPAWRANALSSSSSSVPVKTAASTVWSPMLHSTATVVRPPSLQAKTASPHVAPSHPLPPPPIPLAPPPPIPPTTAPPASPSPPSAPAAPDPQTPDTQL
eukprot:m51a1_g2176 hypothetical protein (772) ;mRNA; r:81111-84047